MDNKPDSKKTKKKQKKKLFITHKMFQVREEKFVKRAGCHLNGGAQVGDTSMTKEEEHGRKAHRKWKL